jgi:hypothetical protein
MRVSPLQHMQHPDLLLQHRCETLVTHLWNIWKHLKYTFATCSFSAMSSDCLDEWRSRRCGARHQRRGRQWHMELASAQRRHRATLGEQLREAANNLASSAACSTSTLASTPGWRAPMRRENSFKEVRMGASKRRRSKWEATSVHLAVLDRALSRF